MERRLKNLIMCYISLLVHKINNIPRKLLLQQCADVIISEMNLILSATRTLSTAGHETLQDATTNYGNKIYLPTSSQNLRYLTIINMKDKADTLSN